ncbi:MAG: class I SAM-dependent methyltransferase [Candidatus Aenigmarchaeota archaeon]|nr:class I SAM-dependent methyltransferase [Candidatus Aenigmarchaeota archaeon]
MNDALYTKLAKWYDKVYVDEKDTRESLIFLKKIFKRHNVKNILDVACGAGRHLIPLIKEGYKVDGIDYSKTFVKMLKEKIKKGKLKSNVRFGDMSNFKTKKRYDALICMFTSFAYMYSPELQLKTFRCFNNALKPKGIIVIDIMNGWNLVALKRLKKIIKTVAEKENLKLVNEDRIMPDGRYQRITILSKYIGYENGKMKVKTKSKIELAMLSPDYLKLLSKCTGFDTISIYGNYNFKRIEQYKKDEKISKLILVAKKVK